jgi:hypothetical protein
MEITFKNKKDKFIYNTDKSKTIIKTIYEIIDFVYENLDDNWYLFEIENGTLKHYKIIDTLNKTKCTFLYSKFINNKLYIKNVY